MHHVRALVGRLPAVTVFALLWVLLGTPAPAPAEDVPLGKETYLTPPTEIADAVLATRNEIRTLTNLSPDGKKFLITKSDGLPPLKRLARPAVHLAEMNFDPAACREHGLYTRSADGFDLFFHADKRTVPVQVPDGARVSHPVWSPDGTLLAFFAHFEDHTDIYLADTDTGFSRRLTTTPVLATLVTTFQWSQDGKQIETVLVPDDGKREMPKPSPVALEPKVRVTRGGNNPSRTYRYLLESPYDAKLLEYLITGQLVLIDVRDGKVTKVGCPNMIRTVTMAPGGDHFRVTTVKKPFSYFVPFTNFGSQEGIWNQDGKSLYTLADRNLRDSDVQAAVPATAPATGGGRGGRGGTAGQPATAPPQPDPAVTQPDPPQQPPQPGPDPNPNPDNQPRRGPVDPNAKRDISWRPDGTGLSCLQLEPEKKDSKEPRKDRVLQILPPFGNDDAKVVYETPNRITRVQYTDDCKTLFLTQTVDNQQQIIAVDLADPKTTYTIYKSGAGDAGGQPTPPAADQPGEGDDDEQPPPGRGGPRGRGGFGGPSLLTRQGRGEAPVVRVSSTGDVYITGTNRAGGAESPVPKPYLDKVNIKTGKKTRVFEGKGEMLETVDAVDGNDVKLVFTTRQMKDVVPDSYVTDVQSGKSTKLTNNVDNCTWAHKLNVQRFRVTRADGFKFWVKVTLPAKAEGKLPALFWIYPREYTDQAAYDAASGRNAAQANRFDAPGPRSMVLLTLLGYAVVEPDVPIVGPAGKMNDNYVPDLRNSLWAAIDELDKKGIIDRDRLAWGGHSYGAFSTANALAHTPFFKAGIAGDGNYNRTLTSMTFQTERRQLWEARETYLEMSPLLWANRVNGALLMYHGMEDANVGTNPINAEHLFMALDGLGKPAALYMYPYEGHGPIARETTLDMWARWTTWLDTYVKNPKKRKKPDEAKDDKKGE
jgi:dipeptidyl aminopeptidase/acylaminoacyl peptidase